LWPFSARRRSRRNSWEHGYPFGQLVAVGEERGTVGSSVEHVELVGELVVYHVVSLLGVARTVEDGVPHKNQQTLGKGLP
jgi:hypothetical protein